MKYRFTDLVDIAQFRALMEAFYQATGIPHGLIDTEHNILSGSGWQNICTEFHRVCPESVSRCHESDRYIASHLRDGPFVGYKCLNGLMDYATPVVIEGEHLATLFVGQFLHEPPDVEAFRLQARQFGFDEAAYLEALSKVPIIAREKLQPIMAYYAELATLMAGSGLERLRHLEAEGEVQVLNRELTQRVEDRTRELALSEQRYRVLFEVAPVACVVWEPGHRVVEWNRMAEEMFGWRREEVLGRNFFEFMVPPEARTAVQAVVDAPIESGVPTHSVDLNLTKHGGAIVCEWFNAVLGNPAGRAPCVISMCTDVTARKALEEELRNLNADLERRVDDEVAKNREKDHILIQQSRLAAMGEMVHNIAHQWRQPLNALSIILTNVKDDYEFHELTQESLDRDVKRAVELLKGMSSTIDDFRDFFRPDREPGEFEMAKAVADALFVMEASLANSGIAVDKTLAPGLIAYGYCNQFAQAIMNVLANAKEAIQQHRPSGGVIRIELARSGGNGVLAIEDNGGGIPAEALPRVFDPYFTTKEQGSGIGLYMSKMIVERNLKGSMEAENRSGGARVTIALPLQEPRAR